MRIVVSGDVLQKRPLYVAVRPASTRCPISEYGVPDECAIGKMGFPFFVFRNPTSLDTDNRKTKTENGKRMTLHLVIRHACGFPFVIGDVDLEVGKQRGRFALQHAQHGDRHASDLELSASPPRSSSIVRHARAFP